MDYIIVMETGGGFPVTWESDEGSIFEYVNACKKIGELCYFNDGAVMASSEKIQLIIKQESTTTKSNIVVPQTNASIDFSKLR